MKFFSSSPRTLQFSFFFLMAILVLISFACCNPFIARFIAKSFEDIPQDPVTIVIKTENPVLPSVGLSALWVGHATCLIQIGDKVIITDPMLTNTAGIVSKRKVEAGIHSTLLERLDYILISHLHFDHLNYGSLDLLPKSAIVLLPTGSAKYIPEFGFYEYLEIQPWTSVEKDGVRITAVPVKHFNGRYGFDVTWLDEDTFTGYIVEYEGRTVFFAGDTGYDPEKFKEIGKKFSIDLALIPIAPIEPRDFMKRVHADPQEALQIFYDVRAKVMIPIHHRTFVQGLDSTLTYAQEQLRQLTIEQHIKDRVLILRAGEQRILIP